MRRDFTLQRRVIIGGLALLVLADCGLGAFSWRQASAPRTPQQELDRQNIQLRLLQGDIDRAKAIQRSMPVTQIDCEKFEKSLLPASIGYSAVAEELGGIAGKAGLQISGVNFRHKELPNRGLSEVELEATISGDYAAVVRFLNGLQRSENVYTVDSLALASDNQSQGASAAIRVTLHLRTFFRAA
ncbi:MAG TPA: GspMb/PilO family protein [Candidatus Acidoferrum sp.]|nr:GspMb/PilO family protein [Candidatus Acidoferrum sp.]